jgi:hypothetical protein
VTGLDDGARAMISIKRDNIGWRMFIRYPVKRRWRTRIGDEVVVWS